MSDTFDHYGDALDSLLDFDRHDDYDYPLGGIGLRSRKRFDLVCRRCGTAGLHWVSTPNGWRLSENNCGGATADDFEDIS